MDQREGVADSYLIYKKFPILSQICLTQFPLSFFNVHFNIILPFTSGSGPFRMPHPDHDFPVHPVGTVMDDCRFIISMDPHRLPREGGGGVASL